MVRKKLIKLHVINSEIKYHDSWDIDYSNVNPFPTHKFYWYRTLLTKINRMCNLIFMEEDKILVDSIWCSPMVLSEIFLDLAEFDFIPLFFNEEDDYENHCGNIFGNVKVFVNRSQNENEVLIGNNGTKLGCITIDNLNVR